MSEPQWHYFHDRIVEGPKSQADLCDLFRSGTVPLDILVWNKALGDWKPATEVDCFRSLRSASGTGRQSTSLPLSPSPSPPPQSLSTGQGSGSYPPPPPPPPPPPISIAAPPPGTPAKKGRLLPILAGIVVVGAIIGAACYWFKPSVPGIGPIAALPAFIPLPTRAPEPTGDSSPTPAASPSSASPSLLPGPSPVPMAGDVAEILNQETIEAFIRSYYEGVENKDVERVMADYDAVVACGPQGLRTRTAIRADLVTYFAQYRSLLISIEAVHLDIDPAKALAHVSFTIRYRKLPEQGPLDAGHGIEKWSLIVHNGKPAISSIEETFFSAP